MTEGRTSKQELHRFLRSYRATPHSTTWRSPAELVFNRPLKTKLPEISHCSIHDDHVLRHRDCTAKQRQELYSDQRRRARPSKVQEGDQVIIRWRQLNKAMHRFNPQPYKVVDVNGSMITALSQTDGREVTRNYLFTKRLQPESSTTSDTRGENQSTESTPDADTETEPA